MLRFQKFQKIVSQEGLGLSDSITRKSILSESKDVHELISSQISTFLSRSSIYASALSHSFLSTKMGGHTLPPLGRTPKTMVVVNNCLAQ
uniref:Uncharacterized protein n=1 Tax=Lepeophtheirus salmonis TaxID=72036 RepID=A0A0K2VIG0_LEPSM